MVDTVHWWLPSSLYDKVDKNYLTNITEHKKADGQYYISGNLENQKINISQSGMSLKGSLCKYYYGNNFDTLSWHDSTLAIKKIQDHLHVSMDNAKITRLDFAQNLEVKHPPESYFPYLAESKYLSRHQYKHSLYWKNKGRVKTLYNKIEEAFTNDILPPTRFIDKNVLRFEVRYLNRVNNRFKRTITGTTFNDQSFYKQLGHHWGKAYFDIQKTNNLNFDITHVNTPKEFSSLLILLGIKQLGGYENAWGLLNSIHFSHPEYASRAKGKLREVLQLFQNEDTSPIVELDNLVQDNKYNYL